MRNKLPDGKKYNFFIDDNIFFFNDIQKHCYPSVFDNFYLGGLRKAHEKYGTKFTLNCFWKNWHNPSFDLCLAKLCDKAARNLDMPCVKLYGHVRDVLYIWIDEQAVPYIPFCLGLFRFLRPHLPDHIAYLAPIRPCISIIEVTICRKGANGPRDNRVYALREYRSPIAKHGAIGLVVPCNVTIDYGYNLLA